MVAEMLAPERDFRGPGCTDACRVIKVIRPGMFGRQDLLQHDPESHEMHGRAIAGDVAARMVLETGVLTINRSTLDVAVVGEAVDLTSVEMRLLLHLADRLGRYSLDRELVAEVWGQEDHSQRNLSLISSNLSRLRAKLGDRAAGLIERRKTVGLRLRDWPVGRDAPWVRPAVPKARPS